MITNNAITATIRELSAKMDAITEERGWVSEACELRDIIRHLEALEGNGYFED